MSRQDPDWPVADSPRADLVQKVCNECKMKIPR